MNTSNTKQSRDAYRVAQYTAETLALDILHTLDAIEVDRNVNEDTWASVGTMTHIIGKMEELKEMVNSYRRARGVRFCDKPEAFYTGGGVWVAALYVDNDHYYTIDNDTEGRCLALYDRRLEDPSEEEYPCQEMIRSVSAENFTKEEVLIYAKLRRALDAAMK